MLFPWGKSNLNAIASVGFNYSIILAIWMQYLILLKKNTSLQLEKDWCDHVIKESSHLIKYKSATGIMHIKGNFYQSKVTTSLASTQRLDCFAYHCEFNAQLQNGARLYHLWQKNGEIRQDTNLFLQLVELFSSTLAVIRIVPHTII